MSLVLDASLTLSWLFEDEASATDAVLDEVMTLGARVPSLWRLEVANALQLAVRRRRITGDYRDEALHRVGALPVIVDGETDRHAWFETLRLADRFALTVYDATYLELARRLVLPIATLDKALAHAARASKLEVFGV